MTEIGFLLVNSKALDVYHLISRAFCSHDENNKSAIWSSEEKETDKIRVSRKSVVDVIGVRATESTKAQLEL